MTNVIGKYNFYSFLLNVFSNDARLTSIVIRRIFSFSFCSFYFCGLLKRNFFSWFNDKFDSYREKKVTTFTFSHKFCSSAFSGFYVYKTIVYCASYILYLYWIFYLKRSNKFLLISTTLRFQYNKYLRINRKRHMKFCIVLP